MDKLQQLELIEREIAKRGLLKPQPQEELFLDEGHYFENPEEIEQYYQPKIASSAESYSKAPAETSDEPEYSYADRAMQGVRGLVGGAGFMGDLAHRAGSAIANAPRMTPDFQYENPEEPAEYYDRSRAGLSAREYKSPNYSEELPNKLDKLYGKSLEPTDTTGRILEGAGSFMLPVPGSGYLGAAKAAKSAYGAGKGLLSASKPLAKTVAKEVGMGTGASIALETPDITEEGTAANAVEKMAKGIFGAHYGNKAVSKATIETLKSIPNAFKPGDVTAKILSIKTKANPETFSLAKKHNIDLPFNVGLEGTGGKFKNFLANTYLKTAFVSNAYNEVLKNADLSFVTAIKNKIDTLGPTALKPHEASLEYRNLIKAEEKKASKVSSQLYDSVDEFLKPGDTIIPTHTKEYIGSLKEIMNRDIQSPSTKRVASILDKLATKWGFTSERPKINIDGVEKLSPISQQRINQVLDSFESTNKPIEIKRLNGVRKELGNILQHKERVVGVESLLEGVRSSLMKDMEGSSNKAYVAALKEANKVFRENIALRFRTDMANSLLRGESPVEAFNLMNNVQNIKDLEKIAGENIKSKQIFNALKKAKVNEIFSNAIKEEGVSTGNFINHFNTGKKNEVLEHLLGKKSYGDLSEISKVAKAYQKSDRELLNTSGTSMSSADLNRVGKLVHIAIGIVTGTGIGPITGLASIAAPILVSKLVSNPKTVEKMREYVLSRSLDLKNLNGVPSKHSKVILDSLYNMSLKDAQIALNSAEETRRYNENNKEKEK